MGRLTTLKPRLATQPSRLGYAPGDEKARDKRRRQTQQSRNWYKTKRWADLKLQAHVRDNYTCQRTGELLVGKGNAPNAPVANHKIPHHGDPKLFWDLDNIETVAKWVHDSEIQKEERAAERGGLTG